MAEIPIDHEHFVLTPDYSLLIRGVTVDDAGQYVCYQGATHFLTYQVDVIMNEKRIQVSGPSNSIYYMSNMSTLLAAFSQRAQD